MQRLRTVRTLDPRDRVRHWWKNLSDSRHDSIFATDLYLGDHWSIIKSLPHIATESDYRAFLWVASAGYGLIPQVARIRPYSATFANGHPDSVFTHQLGEIKFDVLRAWWRHLSEMPGPAHEAPRSVREIAESDPATSILVIGSYDYVGAMEEDLCEAVGALGDANNLIVISTPPTGLQDPLRSHCVPSAARLQATLGGSRPSLHARVARKILSEASRWDLRADVLVERYEGLLAKSPTLKKFDREAMTDDQVSKFIREERRSNPSLSCSRLLRTLRDSGYACEQARFRKLFHKMGEVELD